MSQGPPGDWREDIEKLQQYEGQEFDTSIPAIAEFVFGSLTAIVAICWFVAMLWVPDAIAGPVWLGGGMLGFVLFGLPAGGIYLLRRGGIETVVGIIRQLG